MNHLAGLIASNWEAFLAALGVRVMFTSTGHMTQVFRCFSFCSKARRTGSQGVTIAAGGLNRTASHSPQTSSCELDRLHRLVGMAPFFW